MIVAVQFYKTTMTYTEIKERNGKKYYYRVVSIRKGSSVIKKREYLGVNLNKEELKQKEIEANDSLSQNNKAFEEKARKNLLKKSEKVKGTIIKGYDFNNGLNYEKLIQSYEST